MSSIDQYTDELADEALKEAADTFFGKRRKVEDEIKLFESKVEELKDKSREIEMLVSGINYLLLRERHCVFFWQIFGAEELASREDEGSFPDLPISVPFSIRPFSRYFKLLLDLYEKTAKKVKAYNHGEYIDHPEVSGKKVATISYSYIYRWLDQINAKIDKLNYYHKSSDVLQFAKKMDVQRTEKEKIAGADFTYSLDEDLKMSRLNMKDYEIPVFPDLPESRGFKGRVKKICKRVYSGNKQEVRSRMKQIAKGSDERGE